jgi:hypothetical protein
MAILYHRGCRNRQAAYRWNPYTEHWEFWNVFSWMWVKSYIDDANKLLSHSRTFLYEDTFCEPFEEY